MIQVVGHRSDGWRTSMYADFLQFAQAYSNARSDDVGSLQKAGQGLRYLEPGVPLRELSIDPEDFKSRIRRGFYHPFFAKLLCPHVFSLEFEKDPAR